MASFVLDASVAATWCLKTEATPYTDAILNAVAGPMEATAPRLWAYEIRNSVRSGMRRNRVTQADAEVFLRSLSDLRITLMDPSSYDDIFLIADRYKLTVYDAAYLELAIRRGLSIASLDKELVQAATQAGISLFRP